MDQTVKPPLATWIVEVDGVPKTPASSAWVDEWTLLLTVAAIPALPAGVTVEYTGPDTDLQTTWGKQWEPWGPIVATSFQVIPVGLIAMWSGAVVDIPPGWLICDGSNGTPDLTDMFVVGAGDSYDPGNTGGSDSHDHWFQGFGHDHDLLPPADGGVVQRGPGWQEKTDTSAEAGRTDFTDHRPKYYALAFVMKV